MREMDPLIAEYRHEKKRPRESEALFMLRKVASIVKPIMRQRAWRVGALCEFYPKQSNLLGLNVNSGQKICLRLRYASDQKQFLPFEQIVDTMLHELCHIVRGPHDRRFHALWNQLRDEHEELVLKGYTGEGFLSQGKRLGGTRMPLDEARRQARASAEQRRAQAKSSGKKLGGAPVLRGTDPRKLRADAAQRRLEVEGGCASGTAEGTELAEEAYNGFKTKAEEDDANEAAIMQAFIELIQEEEREKYGSSYMPPSQENPAGPSTQESPPSSESGDLLKAKPAEIPQTEVSRGLHPTNDNKSYDASWTCPACTLENQPAFLCCDACGSERPVPKDTKPAESMQRSELPDRTRSEEKRTKKRPLPDDKTEEEERAVSRHTFAFKNRNRALDTLKSIDREVNKKRLGWNCGVCGSFMESQWWTCSACGTMKATS